MQESNTYKTTSVDLIGVDISGLNEPDFTHMKEKNLFIKNSTIRWVFAFGESKFFQVVKNSHVLSCKFTHLNHKTDRLGDNYLYECVFRNGGFIIDKDTILNFSRVTNCDVYLHRNADIDGTVFENCTINIFGGGSLVLDRRYFINCVEKELPTT